MRWFWPDAATRGGADRAVLHGAIAAAWLCLSSFLFYFEDPMHLPGTAEGSAALAAYASLTALFGLLAYRIFFKRCAVSSLVVLVLSALRIGLEITTHSVALPTNTIGIFVLFTVLVFSINGVRGTLSSKKMHVQTSPFVLKDLFWQNVSSFEGASGAVLHGALVAAWTCLSFADMLFKDSKSLFGADRDISYAAINIIFVVAAGYLAYRILKKHCLVSSLAIFVYPEFVFVYHYVIKKCTLSWETLLTPLACVFAINGIRGTFAFIRFRSKSHSSEHNEEASSQAAGFGELLRQESRCPRFQNGSKRQAGTGNKRPSAK